jgi:hypothetical protein
MQAQLALMWRRLAVMRAPVPAVLVERGSVAMAVLAATAL